MDLIASAFSDCSPPFVVVNKNGPRPVASVSLRIRHECVLTRVYLRVVINGIDHFIASTREWQEGAFRWHEVQLPLSQPRIHYHFRLHRQDETYYLTRAGIGRVYPTEENDYVIDLDTDAPGWAKGAVFYQIFPDRFCNGDPSLDVSDGEITRDGFKSRRMPWDSPPLPYAKSGSLDFFNGDLSGIEQRLDYLSELGITALYLNPVFLAKTNHRYDCIDYFQVDPHLGGDEALASLVRRAHDKEIRVILDVSINHIGKEHPWSNGLRLEDGSIARVVATDQDGNAVHWMGVPELLKLDYQSSELRDIVYRREDSLVQKYLRPPFSIDGWRFDVASETGNYGSAQAGHTIWQEIRDVVKKINSEAYILGEHWQDAHSYLQGEEWDSAMNYFASGRAIRMWIGEADQFALERREEGVAGRPVHGTELGQLIRQHFDRVHSNLLHAQFNLIDSHDVTRLHNNAVVFEWDLYAGAVALLFFLPGAVNIYYGDEVGIDGNLDGDHGKRFPMPWDREKWDLRFVRLYRELTALKRSEQALRTGAYLIIHEEENLFALARVGEESTLLLIVNRHDRETTHRVPVWKLGIDGADVLSLLGQTERHLDTMNDHIEVRLPARQSAILLCSS